MNARHLLLAATLTLYGCGTHNQTAEEYIATIPAERRSQMENIIAMCGKELIETQRSVKQNLIEEKTQLDHWCTPQRASLQPYCNMGYDQYNNQLSYKSMLDNEVQRRRNERMHRHHVAARLK